MRLLIDTDTASDDAVALLLALRTPGVRVEAITVVAGNVEVAQGVQNALYTVELAGASVPVYAGRTGTLLEASAAKPPTPGGETGSPKATRRHFGHAVHGQDGMGDIGLPLHGREPAAGDAVDALERLIRDAPDQYTLVTLGPLTNVAALFERGVAPLLHEVVIMGGTSDDVGNVTQHAEYNVWADPDAARTVFESGAAITMVGWDVSRTFAVFTPADQDELRAVGPLGNFAVDIQRTLIEFCRTQTKLDGFDLPDPIAMAVALDRSVATATVRARIEVDRETAQTHLRGGEPPPGSRPGVGGFADDASGQLCEVVVEASRERFVALLRDALRG